MRPGRRRPGCCNRTLDVAADRTRFNEAGATSPRMYRAVAAPHCETGASMRPGRRRPGCLPLTTHNQVPGLRASMRPGRRRPGCPWIIWLIRYRNIASMRPGRRRPGCLVQGQGAKGLLVARFNEAGATSPRMCSDGAEAMPEAMAASMRPGRRRPGCRHDPGDSGTGTDCASMRPGRRRPGCPSHSPKDDAGSKASMRPGRRRPGCLGEFAAEWGDAALQ